jgi:hypothetical protein
LIFLKDVLQLLSDMEKAARKTKIEEAFLKIKDSKLVRAVGHYIQAILSFLKPKEIKIIPTEKDPLGEFIKTLGPRAEQDVSNAGLTAKQLNALSRNAVNHMGDPDYPTPESHRG